MSNDWNNDILRGKGFTQGSDGSWHKSGVRDRDTASPADPKPDPKRKPPRPAPVERLELPRFLALVTISTRRDRDGDNQNAKWFCDAITHGGCHWPDDSAKHLETVFIPRKVRTKEEEGCKIEVFPLNEAAETLSNPIPCL